MRPRTRIDLEFDSDWERVSSARKRMAASLDAWSIRTKFILGYTTMYHDVVPPNIGPDRQYVNDMNDITADMSSPLYSPAYREDSMHNMYKRSFFH